MTRIDAERLRELARAMAGVGDAFTRLGAGFERAHESFGRVLDAALCAVPAVEGEQRLEESG